MEAVLGFVTGILFAWWFPLIIFTFALFSEAGDAAGWATFFFIVAVVSLVGVFGVTSWSPTLIGLGLLGYFVAGCVHSMWRWYRYTEVKTEKFNEACKDSAPTDYQKDKYLQNTDFRNKLDTISYWALAWPVSGLAYLVADTLVLIRKAIVTWFSGMFDSITERARGKANINR